MALPEEAIISKIYLIRGKEVMLDRDLADLYRVETRVLDQAVRRNRRRFPKDFMFPLTPTEFKILISRSVTSSWGGIRKLPLAFTEQGVAMLSSILNSETAIDVNIRIIRVFTRMRDLLLTHKDILLKLEQLEKKLMRQDSRTKKNEEDMQMIFIALKKLLDPPQSPRPPNRFSKSK